jgi:hypothetical protein
MLEEPKDLLLFLLDGAGVFVTLLSAVLEPVAAVEDPFPEFLEDPTVTRVDTLSGVRHAPRLMGLQLSFQHHRLSALGASCRLFAFIARGGQSLLRPKVLLL